MKATERGRARATLARAPAKKRTAKLVAAPAPKTIATPAQSAQRYETIALVLQGGGALGSYQCGVYEGLHDAGIRPNWFAGISIGAINAALLAGNAPEDRVERLRSFWQRVSIPALPFAQIALDLQQNFLDALPWQDELIAAANSQGALAALLFGQSGFFVPRVPPPLPLVSNGDSATSFYDTAPLKATLEQFVDFDRINAKSAGVRFSVSAVNVRSGNFVSFDNATTKIRAEHVMASGALPPAFAAVEIDGEHYWDGGLVSNTPLDYVLGATPRCDSLVLQVDLWRAQGEVPRNLGDVLERQKDIQYSSRTRFHTKVIRDWQDVRTTLHTLLKQIPPEQITAEMRRELDPWLSDRVYNIIHLIYSAKPFEEQYKDYAFAPSTMRDHWQAGLVDMQRTLRRAEFFEPPSRRVGAVTHDVNR